MLTRIFSAAVIGIDAIEIEIEIHSGAGVPSIILVGLPDTAVKESKDRVTAAISNSGYRPPRKRTTVNLAPADIKKQGPSFDLPIALGMIATDREEFLPRLSECSVAGELGLTGNIRPIKGALPFTLEARSKGKTSVLLPIENTAEASIVEGISVYGVKHLRSAYEFLSEKIDLEVTKNSNPCFENYSSDIDFSDVQGQYHVKRAIEVAVAGGHNILLIGPPGSGKSMLARRIPTIMPKMSLEESIETTKIHSVYGILKHGESIISQRPFRDPHHTISNIGLIGGTSSITPGEISLAHHGVLFLDELPEFQRTTLEVMRQPLEEGKVTISRAIGSITYPSRFMLVAAMNPCPCGYKGDKKRECHCSIIAVQRYRQKISGPLLDRIDIHIEAPAVEYHELTNHTVSESSATIRERIVAARNIQYARFGQGCNAHMTNTDIKKYCFLNDNGNALLQKAMNNLNFSVRSYHRILKVARTIADLAGSSSILENHLLEALNFRKIDR